MKQLLLFFGILGVCHLHAQGCSDAGICSVSNSFEPKANQSRQSIELGGAYGAGEADVEYLTSHLTYTRELGRQFALSTKVTFNVAQGSFGKRGTFGDAYLIGNYQLPSTKTQQWSVLAGIKFPFTSANLKINGYSLPMDYQASLGTFDWIAMANLNYKHWDFNAGIQLPVFNINRNSYLSEFSGTYAFPSTNLFERKPDALFRATYRFDTSKQKFRFKPNVLFIYHLGRDSYETIYGKRENIAGSGGLTINGNLIALYAVNTKSSIELSVAAPFVVRKIRPDGLTRAFTAGITYKTSL
jgi:hypothetical protein